MTDKIAILLSAVLLAAAVYYLQSTVFVLVLFGLIVCSIYRSGIEDRNFIIRVLIAGFLLRVSIAVVLHALSYLKGYGGSVSGDDLLYTVKGWMILQKWSGLYWISPLASSPEYGVNPFTFILALFYKLNGFHPLAVKFLNCAMGTLIGWVSYLISRELFDRRAARIAMIIVVFYPSLLRWSIANLKDVMMILTFMLSIYFILRMLYNSIEVWKCAILSLSLAVLYLFAQKFYFSLGLMAVCGLVLLKMAVFFIRRGLKKIVFFGCFIMLAAGCYYLLYVNNGLLLDFIYDCMDKQAVIARSDSAGYFLYTRDFRSLLEKGIISVPILAQIVFMDVVYFLFTPFLWQMTSRESIVALPQMFAWYVIFILSIFGYAMTAVKKSAAAILLGMILFTGIIVNSLAEGNIGSAFRHRDFFTPFFIIFASKTLSELFRLKGPAPGAER